MGSNDPVHQGCPIGPELGVKQTKTAEKQTFRVMSRRCFIPRHATGKRLDPKVLQADLGARYLGEGLGGGVPRADGTSA